MMVLSPRNAASRPTSGNGVQLSDALRFMEGASQRRGMEDSAAASSGLVRPLLIHEGDLHCPALLEQAVKAKRARLPGVAEGFGDASKAKEDYSLASAPTTAGPSLPQSDDV